MPVVEQVKKVLNANLASRKKSAERVGWKISQTKDGWTAEKKINGEFERISRTRLGDVLDQADVMSPFGKTKVTNELTNVNDFVNPYDEVPLELIDISITVPQQIRRKRFTEDNLKELIESVRTKGVLEPVLLRKQNERFELVAGERRFLAAGRANLSVIPALIREMTDADVIDIQLHENLHRENPHPMDEGLNFDYMRTKQNFPIAEISLRVGKTERYVAERLKLIELPENIREAFSTDRITLSHALEIARYPQNDMELIFKLCFDDFGYVSESLFPMSKVKERIAKHYLLELGKAPFDPNAVNLRADGLACINCPERTGASPLLFDPEIGEKDSCMNRKCYEGKLATHIHIERSNIVVEKLNIPLDKASQNVKKVPLLSTDSWLRDSEKAEFNETLFTNDNYKKLKSFDDCSFAEYGVFAHGDRNGQKEIICRKSSKCPKHWRNASSSSSETKTDAESEQASIERRSRKEEIIDVNVGEPVRRRILAETALNFDAENTIFNHSKSDEFLQRLTARLWKFQTYFSSDTADIIRTALGVTKERLKNDWYGDELGNISKLTADECSRLLYLILHADIAQLHEGGSLKSQKPIKELAEEFNVDYQMIDAVERLKFISAKHEKHAKEFHNYLVKLESGDRSAQIPRVYFADYKPRE